MTVTRLLAIGLVALCGCGDETDLAPPLFLEDLSWACALPSDPACDEVNPRPLPDASGLSPKPLVAVGAVFDIGGPTRATEGTIVDSQVAAGWEFVKAGVGAVTTGSGFVHLRAVEPAGLVIAHETNVAGHTFADVVGVDTFSIRYPRDRFRAYLVDADGTILIGALPCKWTSNDASVVTVVGDDTANVMTVEIQGEGSTTVDLEYGDYTGVVNFDVTFN